MPHIRRTYPLNEIQIIGSSTRKRKSEEVYPCLLLLVMVVHGSSWRSLLMYMAVKDAKTGVKPPNKFKTRTFCFLCFVVF